MKVYIIGAGPGDPDLITVKGAKLVEPCPIVFYTGSLVPKEVIARARADAEVVDSSGMTLDEIIEVLERAHKEDLDVARVHTGDPAIYGSTAEQCRHLDRLNIPWEMIPGVSSFSAAAAAVGKELTLPELSQTIILTRAEGRTPMPEKEKLPMLGQHGATMCLFLSVMLIRKVQKELIPTYGEDCPVIVVQKASCSDQKVVKGTLSDIHEKIRAEKIRSQAMIIIGHVLTSTDFADSRLYAADFGHKFRAATRPATERQPAN